jgi:hypothetical protein
MELIKEKAGKKNTRYILPHKEILRIPGVERVRVFAFGPPHQASLLADFAAAEAAEDSNAAHDIQPFARRFALPFRQAFSDPQYGTFFNEHYGKMADAGHAEITRESNSNAAWRRIDNDWLYSAEYLALYLNQAINNTSLVLAFELEESGKVLLFIGDAQRRNWKSWTSGSWKDGERRITVRDLMSRTVLYKVGHHGSHNATLKGTAEDEYPNLGWMGHGRYGTELVAMITAVNKWAMAVKPTPWRHPLPSIKKALQKKCEGRVFQTDTKNLKPPSDPSVSGWKEFMARTHIDPGNLYFDYEVHDR